MTTAERWYQEMRELGAGLRYDFTLRRGEVVLPGLGCTDMTGCIRFFERVDADVLEIHTFNEGGRDTTYQRRGLEASAAGGVGACRWVSMPVGDPTTREARATR